MLSEEVDHSHESIREALCPMGIVEWQHLAVKSLECNARKRMPELQSTVRF